MSPVSFKQLFESDNRRRDKFLSRLFGIFSEEIVKTWCSEQWSPYEDLGRPTLKLLNDERGSTLDFTLKSMHDGRIFVAEQKCELERDNYRNLQLRQSSQVEQYKSEAFRRLLDFAKNPTKYSVTARGKTVSPQGAILIWGSVTEDGRASVLTKTGLADVLSLEQIINDLLSRGSQGYLRLMDEKAAWCRHLFDGLARKP